MAFDKHANLIKVTVTVAPSPATTGLTLSISNADATAFTTAGLTAPFNMLAQPISGVTETNVEIIRITAIGAADSGGVGNAQLTITRTAETQPGSARSIIIGDYLTNNITAKTLTDIETYTPAYLANATPTANNIPVLDANALLPYSTGWFPLNSTLAYSSVDGHTFVITSSVDMTGSIGLGDRIKFTNNATTFYGIVTAIAAGTITLYGGTQYVVANFAITSPFFSHWKTPFGFLTRPDYWTEIMSDTSTRLQGTPTNATWYNLGSLKLDIPIGVWIVSHTESADSQKGSANTDIYVTLSTANNTESNTEFTGNVYAPLLEIQETFFKQSYLVLASKTSYYLNAKTASSASQLAFLGGQSATIIRAICAYL